MWRQGRKVGRTIYVQRGGDPSDDDELIGVMDTPELARAACEGFNRLNFVEQHRMHEALDLSSRITMALTEKCDATTDAHGCLDADDGARHARDAHTAVEVILREGWKR
jgi:hypothetical protein